MWWMWQGRRSRKAGLLPLLYIIDRLKESAPAGHRRKTLPIHITLVGAIVSYSAFYLFVAACVFYVCEP